MAQDFARIDSRVDADRGATLHLFDPHTEELFYKDGKPITINLLGLDSAIGRRAIARLGRETGRKKKKERDLWDHTVEEILALAATGEKNNAKLYAAITTGWSNIWFVDDVNDTSEKPRELSFTEPGAVKLYTARVWIMEQIADFLGDKANFALASKKS